ncbi:hypothetical protein APHAL10511_004879 [Amanita phalloides]|nr:hypothetical protein APHAL10511_004879 [Amanita phalloides]
MTRKNRDSPGDNPKRITDYFTRSKSSAESIATISSSASNAFTRRDNQKNEEPVALRKSSRPTRAPLRRDIEMRTVSSSKRMRSPDVTSPRGKTSTTSGSRSKQSKRQKKFESDSDVEMTNSAVIYVRSPGRSGKPSTLEQTAIKCFETISTSQSDEVELDSARMTSILERDTYEVRMCVEKWRSQAPPVLSSVLGDEDVHMQDANMRRSPLTSVPSTPKSFVSNRPNVNPDSFIPGLPTPPVSEDLLAHPLSLDEKTKTELLIEKMKSDAMARAQQLQDSPPPQFDETLDSSSDEEELTFAVPVGPKDKEKRTSNKVGLDTGASKPASGARRSSRNHEAASSTFAVPSESRSSITRKGAQPDARKGRTYNPLDALLSEKRKLQETGKDAQAFIRAESALAAREAWQEEDMCDNEDIKKWQDEDAVRDVIEELLSNDQTFLDGNSTRDISLDAESAARMIGINGTKVVDILENDKDLKIQDTLDGPGLQLWDKSRTNSDRCISSGSPYSSFQYSGQEPVIGILKTALDEQDCAQAISILNSGYLASIDLSDCEGLILFLCEQALSSTPKIFELHAFHALLSIYSDPGSSAARFSAAWVFRTLALLGAEPSVLKQMGYYATSVNVNIDPDYRADAMLRLICVLKTATRSGRIKIHDIADIILAVQRIALDPSASHQLRMAVTNLVDHLCNLATSDEERHIYEKATSLILTLDLACKTEIACMFSRGSGVARRIARWVAYSALTNQPCSRSDDEVPPLNGLLDVVESGNVFQIDDESDYTALWHCVRILGVALTDVELYNLAERGASSTNEGTMEYPTPYKRKTKHKVLLIHEALEALHATIQDTRALHLDRSRAKAAIKQLSLRLRYQHTDSVQDRAIAMPRKETLEHFFSPKKA